MMWWAVVAAVVAALVAPRVLPRVATAEGTPINLAVPLGAVLGLGGGLMADHPVEAVALGFVAAMAAILVVVDLAEHRLPDSVIAAGLAGWLAGAVAMSWLAGEWQGLLRAVLAAAAMFAGFFVLALLANGLMGFGDVKLSALLGAVLGWYGWAGLGRGLLAGVVLHGLAAVVVLVVTRDRKADVAMGPALVAGAIAALALNSV